jgi:hypothetical protein
MDGASRRIHSQHPLACAESDDLSAGNHITRYAMKKYVEIGLFSGQ